MSKQVLVVGSGAREHALAVRLLESPSVSRVIVAPGNAGTAGAQPGISGKVLESASGDPSQIARSAGVDLVVIGPEAPLCAGLVDELFLTLSPVLAGRGGGERLSLVEGVELLPDRRVDGRLLGIRRGGSHLFLRYGSAIRPRP